MNKKNNATIVALKGPDRVRKRPTVVFGSDGTEGATAVVKTLINVFVAEALQGFSKGIDVIINADKSISVRSYDRGFILDETIIDGKPAWQQVFCELYVAPREANENYYYSLERKYADLYGDSGNSECKYQTDTDCGLDLCCVQYVSEFMHVEATRDGVKKIIDFEKGFSVSEMKKEKTSDASNTFVHFLIDSEVFGDVNILTDDVAEFLKCIAVTIPGLKCELHNELEKSSFTFLYPNGTKDYAKEIAPDLSMPLFSNEIEAIGKDRYNQREYTAKVKLDFAFVENNANVICLHNNKNLELGGHHLDKIKEKIMRYVNWVLVRDLEDDYASQTQFELSFEDIQNNVVLILESKCSNYATKYLNATKKAIQNTMITDITSDLISQNFGYYLKQNHDAILDILKSLKNKIV